MNYFVLRDGKEYGPYSLAELQRYVASGNILVTDLTRSEGMSEPVPVSQVIGNIPVPLAAPAQAMVPMTPEYPAPPALHWGVVLLLGVVTCGMFGWVWAIIEGAFVKKVHPQGKSLYFMIAAAGCFVATMFMQFTDARTIAPLFNLLGIGVWIVGAFMMRSELEEHYNNEEPIALDLSGVMTFFFNIYYFQYHLYRISQLKKTAPLTMAQGA